MAYPGTPIEARVDSFNWGIASMDGKTGYELLPKVTPTFDWIRLAQRVPAACRRTRVEIFSIWTLNPTAQNGRKCEG